MSPAEFQQAEDDFCFVCCCPRIGGAMQALSKERLVLLIAWLKERAPSGIPYLVLGMAEHEAAKRFVRDCTPS